MAYGMGKNYDYICTCIPYLMMYNMPNVYMPGISLISFTTHNVTSKVKK